MASAPVADNDAVEAPLTLEYVHKDALVVAEVLVIVEVVCTHHGPGPALLHRCLEGGQVDFVEGAVVQVHVHGVTVDLVVVQREVLHAHGDIVALYALHIGNDHL